jgi:hypothetical protein
LIEVKEPSVTSLNAFNEEIELLIEVKELSVTSLNAFNEEIEP